jgi:hypothetical protein
MKKTFALTAAAAALMFAGSANAAWYVTEGSDGSRIVVNSENMTETALLSGTGGAAPADCPAGSFYDGAQDQVFACDGGTTFNMVEPEAGAMMESGEPYPQGSFLLEEGDGNSSDGSPAGDQQNGEQPQ